MDHEISYSCYDCSRLDSWGGIRSHPCDSYIVCHQRALLMQEPTRVKRRCRYECGNDTYHPYHLLFYIHATEVWPHLHGSTASPQGCSCDTVPETQAQCTTGTSGHRLRHNRGSVPSLLVAWFCVLHFLFPVKSKFSYRFYMLILLYDQFGNECVYLRLEESTFQVGVSANI